MIFPSDIPFLGTVAVTMIIGLLYYIEYPGLLLFFEHVSLKLHHVGMDGQSVYRHANSGSVVSDIEFKRICRRGRGFLNYVVIPLTASMPLAYTGFWALQ